eukprot:4009073-Prymnesium_polylepis.5
MGDMERYARPHERDTRLLIAVASLTGGRSATTASADDHRVHRPTRGAPRPTAPTYTRPYTRRLHMSPQIHTRHTRDIHGYIHNTCTHTQIPHTHTHRIHTRTTLDTGTPHDGGE